MSGISGKLSDEEISNITAFLRSKASDTGIRKLTKPKEYILNPNGEDSTFDLKDDQYVTSEALYLSDFKLQNSELYKKAVTSGMMAGIVNLF